MVERRGEGDCREPWASWEGVSGVVYVGRQESGSLRHAMVGGPVAAAEITAKPQAFGTESVSRGGSFWSPWREGARRKVFYFFIGIQRGRLAPKVRSGEARFVLELDGGKAWRGRLPGALEGGCEYGVEGTKCRERRASWEGVSGVVYGGWQESGSLRHAMVGGPVAAAEITAKPRWAVKTGPGATSSGARCSEPGWAQERKEKFFLDSEGAFGAESAIRGGLFWF